MIPAERVHILLADHNGDPQCLCGFTSPPVAGVIAAASIVAQHVAKENGK